MVYNRDCAASVLINTARLDLTVLVEYLSLWTSGNPRRFERFETSVAEPVDCEYDCSCKSRLHSEYGVVSDGRYALQKIRESEIACAYVTFVTQSLVRCRLPCSYT